MNGITDVHIVARHTKMCVSDIPFLPSLNDQNQLSILIISFRIKFQLKFTISVIIDAIYRFKPSSRAQGFGRKFKRTKLPFALLTDRCANRLNAFDLHR